jgi:hypothetical protein
MFNACENGRPLKSQAVAPMNKCTVSKMVNENIDGCEYCLSENVLLCQLTPLAGLDAMPGQKA